MATDTAIKIKGGNYSAIDTGDGWFTVLDVPIMSEVKKGTKGAPADVGKAELEAVVMKAQEEYKKGAFAGPCHVGHHDDFGITRPEFTGYFLPKSVRPHKFADNEEPKATIFADVKMKASAFERARAGELPFISPEFRFSENRLLSVSFLDSKPPFFHFALFTIGDVRVDHDAKFNAVLSDVETFLESKPNEQGPSDGRGCCRHCRAVTEMSKLMGLNYGGKMSEAETAKLDAAKKLADEAALKAKNEQDVQAVAKFAALESKFMAMQAERDEEKKKQSVRELTDAAMTKLQGHAIGEKTRETIAKFAELGKEKLDELVAELIRVVPKHPSKTVADLEAAGMTMADPALVKFQGDADKMEKAAKALAMYKQWKSKVGSNTSLTAEQFIKSELER